LTITILLIIVVTCVFNIKRVDEISPNYDSIVSNATADINILTVVIPDTTIEMEETTTFYETTPVEMEETTTFYETTPVEMEETTTFYETTPIEMEETTTFYETTPVETITFLKTPKLNFNGTFYFPIERETVLQFRFNNLNPAMVTIDVIFLMESWDNTIQIFRMGQDEFFSIFVTPGHNVILKTRTLFHGEYEQRVVSSSPRTINSKGVYYHLNVSIVGGYMNIHYDEGNFLLKSMLFSSDKICADGTFTFGGISENGHYFSGMMNNIRVNNVLITP
jgi:hypothetical protein